MKMNEKRENTVVPLWLAILQMKDRRHGEQGHEYEHERMKWKGAWKSINYLIMSVFTKTIQDRKSVV